MLSTDLMCVLMKMFQDVDTFVMRAFYAAFFFACFISRIPFFVSVFTFKAKNNYSKTVELVVSVTLCPIFSRSGWKWRLFGCIAVEVGFRCFDVCKINLQVGCYFL